MSQAEQQLREFSMTQEDFAFLGALATKQTGILFPPHKRNLIYGRLSRRLRAHGFHSFAQYCDLLQGDGAAEELPQMVNAVTTNFTSFFREPHHFEHLVREVIAPYAAQEKKGRLRIWSAACSLGMEPYSIGMALLECLPNAAQHDVRILATDIDSKVLETGRVGTYALAEHERLPKKYERFADAYEKKGEMHVVQSVKDLIRFYHLNLIDSWPMKGKFDAIFCRNVVIYFDKDTKRQLFERLADSLVMGGFLYIGHSENLSGISDRFRLVGRTTYQRIR